jgi:hypothetical protein
MEKWIQPKPKSDVQFNGELGYNKEWLAHYTNDVKFEFDERFDKIKNDFENRVRTLENSTNLVNLEKVKLEQQLLAVKDQESKQKEILKLTLEQEFEKQKETYKSEINELNLKLVGQRTIQAGVQGSNFDNEVRTLIANSFPDVEIIKTAKGADYILVF